MTTDMTGGKIDVLVVDDSRVARMVLVHLLESDPRIRVLEAVDSGQAALDFLEEKKADVVLMDIQMPNLDGFETTRRIMETNPVPIITCTATCDPKEIATTFRAMEAGALACLAKPLSPDSPDYDHTARALLETIKVMSEVKVIRRWPKERLRSQPATRPHETESTRYGISMIGIGASTGGPPLLQTILAGLPKNFSVPILIVQHIAPGFVSGLVEWLNSTTSLTVHLAAHDIQPLPGHVYVAPDDFHMGISRYKRITLTREPSEDNLRPAVAYLFRSMAEALGPTAVGVILSGMGKDGAAELKLMKDRGALTIAQDRESSVIHGMPGEAIALGGATHVLPADKIADSLITFVKRQPMAGGLR
jgi:two-component system, chemotaxis family, protein-glutamate methylesterase/glutaminase